ncbi:MAG TPA: DUF6326 family protein [Candidatus Dormibacteraeota bacterium]|nr:DUF6326 family protein [Candidatus Dormibacteraeota bacterium]
MKSRLSILWIFATLNYLYCDVVTLMDPHQLKGFLAGNLAGMAINQAFLFGAGVLVEIPIAMVLLSHVLNRRANRWANVGAGVIMTVVQVMSLVVKAPAAYYLFFSIIEIATTASVVWFAWRWSAAADLQEQRVESHQLLGTE